MRRPPWGDLQASVLGPESGLLERDLVRPRRQVDVDRAARPRAGLERAGLSLELQEDIGQGDITFVADVSDQHGGHFQDGGRIDREVSTAAGRRRRRRGLAGFGLSPPREAMSRNWPPGAAGRGTEPPGPPYEGGQRGFRTGNPSGNRSNETARTPHGRFVPGRRNSPSK